MKIHIIHILIFCLFWASCQDFLDVNDDPTRVKEEQVTLKVLLPSLCESTSAAYASASNIAMNVTHHLDNVQSGYYQRFSNSIAWSEIYLKGIPLAQTIISKAEAENAPHYSGIAKVLEAVNVMLLTDNWEASAYSEANQGSENLNPEFENQEVLYQEVIHLLDEGILDLEKESEITPSADDFFYAGDISKWIKAAHSLKARALFHLLKQGKSTVDDIKSEIALGFAGNTDNFQHYYVSLDANPWFSSISKLINEAIYTKVFGEYFINLLNGEKYDIVDPRLTRIATIIGKDTVITGLQSWVDGDVFTLLPRDTNYLMAANSPNILMSYAELKFIEAEILLNNNPGSAFSAYTEGIRANFKQMNIPDAELETYLMHESVQKFDLEHIIKEKYIALLYNIEAWNDIRRHQFNTDIYKDFVVVPEDNGVKYPPAYRADYPTFEQSRNEQVVNKYSKEITDIMWKDQ